MKLEPGADLRYADLRCAYLRDAKLRYADLKDANLEASKLENADLEGAYLRGSNLQGADLEGANLRGSNLVDANLRCAYMRHADLRDADLEGANLADADLVGVIGLPTLVAAQLSIVPEGDIVGWKKARGGVIVKLEIPREAKRSNAAGRKCRAEYARVVAIYGGPVPTGFAALVSDLSQSLGATRRCGEEAISRHDPEFIYRVGDVVRPTQPFDEDRWEECAPGIHFYLTREEAEAH